MRQSKHLYKAVPCLVPANAHKKEQVKQLLAEYQIIMPRMINRMSSDLIKGNRISSFTSLKPADIDSNISARHIQTAYSQVYESFNSWEAIVQSKVRYIITMSSLSDKQKYILYRINNWKAWYNKDLSLSWKNVDGELVACSTKTKDSLMIPVDKTDLFLMRRIIKKVRQWVKLPNLSNVPTLKLDAKVAVLKNSYNSFAYWLKLSTLTKGKTINLPLKKNSYLIKQLNKGKLLNFVQLNIQNEIIKISPIIEQETVPMRTTGETIGIDWGMISLFTTSNGNRYGRKILSHLKILDAQLVAIQQYSQKNNLSLKTNIHYQKLQSKIRQFVKNEIGRILNKLSIQNIKELKVEKLNFSGGGLSRTLNRLLSRMGRGALKEKIQRLQEEQGILTTQVNPAYTSQMCNRCGFVDRKNRPNQKEFKCLCCGHTINADVNAAQNIKCRRSTLRFKKNELKNFLLEEHSKKCPSGKHSSIMVI